MRLLAGIVVWLSMAGSAWAAFPYEYDGAAPSDLQGKLDWMYAATPEAGNALVNADPRELGGVRGAKLVDRDPSVETAWQTTTGRPDVTIAVLDSGIKWNDLGAMKDLRGKTRLSKGELEPPLRDRSEPSEPGVDCASYADGWDANGDGVFNVLDYACDARVDPAPALGDGPDENGRPLLDPQDVLIAFSDGADDDGNGFVDDVVGWDFLDDDNDPFDDVQYGHGTGEARDSTAEADNGGELGTCPNCMSIHLRVGDSFIADESDFAQAVLYATDNDVRVVQEALGTLNHTSLGRDAVEYAYQHDVAVIASAADEAAQHHNWPSNEPHTIVVNSVTKYDEALTAEPRSYLQFNGCTNFSSKIAVAIPSVSCSSDATGRASGMAGLIYSAALDRGIELSANEVRQLMTGTADDVNFAATELSCSPRAGRPLHRPEPELGEPDPPGRAVPGHRPLPGAQGPRLVLRLRADQHGRCCRGGGRWPHTSAGRDHLTGLVLAGGPGSRVARGARRGLGTRRRLPLRARGGPRLDAERHGRLRARAGRPLRRQRAKRVLLGPGRPARRCRAEAPLPAERWRLQRA